jgi:hypothetical protein
MGKPDWEGVLASNCSLFADFCPDGRHFLAMKIITT